MSVEEDKELLCIPGVKKNYAMDFSCLIEICQDVRPSKVPCLPQYYSGVWNYKGTIIPLIDLEEPSRDKERIALIAQCSGHQFGILIQNEPYIVRKGEVEAVEIPGESDNTDVWKIKEMFRDEEHLFSLIDMERTVEELILF